MKNIKFTYEVKGILEDDILDFESQVEPYEVQYFFNLQNKYPDIINESLDVVLTDNIWESIDKFYQEADEFREHSQLKGMATIIKIITISNHTKYFWSSRTVGDKGIKMFFTVAIEHLISKAIQEKYSMNRLLNINNLFENISSNLFGLWIQHAMSHKHTKSIVETDTINYTDFEDITYGFKRNIKNLHFNYQKIQDDYSFVMASLLELEMYIRRIYTYRNSNNFKGFAEFDPYVKSILTEIDSTNSEIEGIDKADLSIVASINNGHLNDL